MNVIICALCGTVPAFEVVEGGVEWHCDCGATHGFRADRGEIDLGLIRDSELNTEQNLTFFFETFDGVINTETSPSHTVKILGGYVLMPTRRDLIRRHFRTRLSARVRPWKPCVPITCPDVETVEIDHEYTIHLPHTFKAE